ALVVALLVVSHWLLDFVTHRPDMPLYPGGTPLGLGLWNSVAGTVAVEGVMFVAGVWLYATATRARDRTGTYGFWSLIAVLVLSYVGSLLSPPPPTRVALAVGGIIFGWLFVGWAAWGDRHRESVARSEEHTSELQSRFDLVCRLLLEKKNGDGARERVTADVGQHLVAVG